MNWIDGALILLLLVAVIVGSKKGLVREIMAFIVFFVAIIVSVNYIDNFAIWVHDRLGGSTLISAFLSFVLLLAGSYALFKVLGLGFYRIANLKSMGKKDQVGGALVGLLRGWVAIGFLTFLTFLLPMPESYYLAFESSFFGPTIAKTIPLMFDSTAKVHPNNPDFMQKIEKALLPPEQAGKQMLDEDRVQVHRTLYQMERFFTISSDQT